ncbi:hypothetical protein GCM10026982_43910 [Nocardiopsis aegyptia]
MRRPAWAEHLEATGAEIDGPLERIEEEWTRTGGLTALVVGLTGATARPVSGPAAQDPERLARRVYAESPSSADVRITKVRHVRHAWYDDLFRGLVERNAAWRRPAGPGTGREDPAASLRRAVDDLALEVELGFGEVRRAYRITGSAGRRCEYDFAWVDHLLLTDGWAAVLHVGELD